MSSTTKATIHKCTKNPFAKTGNLANFDSGHVFFEKQKADASHAFTASSDGDREEVSHHSSRYPLFGSVDNVVVSVSGLDGFGLDVSNVASSPRLRDCKADVLFPRDYGPADLVLDIFGACNQNRRQRHGINPVVAKHSRADASSFLIHPQARRKQGGESTLTIVANFLDHDELEERVKVIGPGSSEFPCKEGGGGTKSTEYGEGVVMQRRRVVNRTREPDAQANKQEEYLG